jgi:hypothetical protein
VTLAANRIYDAVLHFGSSVSPYPFVFVVERDRNSRTPTAWLHGASGKALTKTPKGSKVLRKILIEGELFIRAQ